MPLGGGDRCPRCDKIVYFAEERRALGRKYHAACLKCMLCGKSLDSTNCSDHDGEIFCNPCHRKQFGPKGYGFASGASGLSVDLGNSYNSSLAQVQAGIVVGTKGSGDLCPRCNCTVYMAERIIGGGKAYHKSCFRCGECSKSLDSTTLCQHEREIYCKACYSRLFGPKGYGFAGGASGLSMDTGKLYEVTRENVSHLAQAQVPQIGSGGDGSKETCSRCSQAVYFAERVASMGKVYHKACFRCSNCNKSLDSTTLTQHEDNIYCKACYSRKFGPKGFGFGAAVVHTQ